MEVLQTAAIAFGGLTPAPAVTGATLMMEQIGQVQDNCKYVTTRRILAGAGTAPNTSGLGFGGYAPGN